MAHLPSSSSPNLAIVHPTHDEKLATWHSNGASFRGSMSLPTYLRREKHLENQAFTRDGGITFWILVDTTASPNARPILASCESFRKRALISRGDGQVQDIISHGIGSVFGNPEYRGRGYAQRMLTELGKELDTWEQENGTQADFTVLYSDIGKKFYAKLGWQPFTSSHIALPPIRSDKELLLSSAVRPLRADDMAGLCILDEKILRDQLAESIHDQSKIRVALIPDIDTIQWHHAREEFTAREMLGTEPDVKGAIATSEGGKRVWCVWTRTFGSTGAGNTLNILRLVIEGERDSERNPLSANEDGTTLKTSSLSRITACAAVLRAAQLEAAKWDMKDVQFWNPSRLAVLAARGIDTSSQVIHRDEENLASLRWHGKADDRDHVEWIGNEKYGWWFVSSVIVQKIY